MDTPFARAPRLRASEGSKRRALAPKLGIARSATRVHDGVGAYSPRIGSLVRGFGRDRRQSDGLLQAGANLLPCTEWSSGESNVVAWQPLPLQRSRHSPSAWQR